MCVCVWVETPFLFYLHTKCPLIWSLIILYFHICLFILDYLSMLVPHTYIDLLVFDFLSFDGVYIAFSSESMANRVVFILVKWKVLHQVKTPSLSLSFNIEKKKTVFFFFFFLEIELLAVDLSIQQVSYDYFDNYFFCVCRIWNTPYHVYTKHINSKICYYQDKQLLFGL